MTSLSKNHVLFVLLSFLTVLFPVFGNETNMIGRQSQNEGILVLPKPGAVTVDGDLKDWDLSGRIWVFADTSVRARFSVKLAAMWDQDYLYLSAQWKDPTPMYSMIDPKFNPNEGWKADSWQLRVRTDRTVHLTTWYSVPQKRPVMHVNYAGSGVGGKTLVLWQGTLPNVGQGVQMAYKMDKDKQGYVQEMRVPWKLLYQKLPEIKPGHKLRIGNELLWGDTTGKTWPIHRYADNMQPGVTSREFYWTNTKAWGNATLMAKGNVPVRKYVQEGSKIVGTVPVRVTIPADAVRATIAINDAQGKRIRNLAGDIEVAEYVVKKDKKSQTIEVLWDCLGDDGKLVTAGNYTVLGLTHMGLGADYDTTFYNPGTPAWGTASGKGAWGADHGPPTEVAAAGKYMLVGWRGVEGGSGIIGIAANGQKQWGEKRSCKVLTADDRHLYAITGSAYASGVLCRFAVKDGKTEPFELDGKERPFELSMKNIFGNDKLGGVTAMAVHGKQLVLCMDKGTLAVLDAETAVPQATFKSAVAQSAAFSKDGKLYVAQNNKVSHVDLKTGAHKLVPTPGIGKIVDIDIDAKGNIVVADAGKDSQIKAYSPQGKLVYTCGTKGGRPLRGKFEPQAMMRLRSVAVAADGKIWTVESWNNPRRVSVWNPATGKLVRDYIGNSAYAGTGSYLDEEDVDAAFVGSLKLRLDRKKRTYSVDEVLWVPDKAKNEGFSLWVHAHWFSNPSFVTSKASGKSIKYLYSNGMYAKWHGIYMKRGKTWQPVAVISTVKEMKVQIPGLDWSKHNDKESVFWNDLNKDAAVQLNECEFAANGMSINGGWGTRPGSDLSLYFRGGTRIKPIRFANDGAPIYGAAGVKKLPVSIYGEAVPIIEEKLVLSMGGHPRDGGYLQATSTDGSKLLWRYPNPYPGVHGSHNATMPKPGLLIGPLKICGVAHVNNTVGRVFLIRGNLGQDFILTTDGLFVGAIFQDGRLPGMSLPDKESSLQGMPMEAFSNGGEPFSGWFGKHTDGKIRLTNGFARQAAMILEINGLEKIKRFKGKDFALAMKEIVKADRENNARKAAATAPKTYTIARMKATPKIDGDARDWSKINALKIERKGSPNRGTAKISYDDKNLYLLVRVSDPSPWKNQGNDHARLFKTGDAVDLQLNTDPGQTKNAKRDKLLPSDLRIVFGQLNKKPVAVLMRPVDKTAPADVKVKYQTGWSRTFDRVEVINAKVSVKAKRRDYLLEAAVPLATIGLKPQAKMTLRGDIGFISSDANGQIDTARTYWSNKNTNLVNDTPLEAWLYPNKWGSFKFE